MENGEHQKFIDDLEFCEFVLREAENTIVHATVEELAEFGFGSMEDAIKAYNEQVEERSN